MTNFRHIAGKACERDNWLCCPEDGVLVLKHTTDTGVSYCIEVQTCPFCSGDLKQPEPRITWTIDSNETVEFTQPVCVDWWDLTSEVTNIKWVSETY